MGNSLQHFNVDALSYIVCTSKSDLKRIIKVYGDIISREEFDETENLAVTADVFAKILEEAEIHVSGICISLCLLLLDNTNR